MQPSDLKQLVTQEQLVFLTGSAGTGKSTLTRELIKMVNNPIILGSTGVASVLVGGQTYHSFFRINGSSTLTELKSGDESFCKSTGMTIQQILSKMTRAIQSADMIIIDEVSMISRDHMECIEYRLQQACVDIPILFVGDMLQLPPVVKSANTKYSPHENFIVNHPWWEHVTPVMLQKIWRTDDLDFISALNKIREGTVDDEVKTFLKSHRLTPDKFAKIDKTKFTFLFGTNSKVRQKNINELSKLETKSHIFNPKLIPMAITPKNKDYDTFLDNNKISTNLELKVGARVMLIKNKNDYENESQSYVNGDTGVITDIDCSSTPTITIKRDRDGGILYVTEVEFEKIKYENTGGSLQKIDEFKVTALPIMLAYAITIHKSQGMSISHLIIDADDLFADSQFYVAVSRSSDPKNLYISWKKERTNMLIHAITKVNKKMVNYYKSLENKGD